MSGQLPRSTVVFDGHPFEEPSYVGIWRYAHRLLSGMAREISTAVIVGNTIHRPIPEGVAVIERRVPRVRGKWDLTRRVGRKWQNRLLARQFRAATCYHSLVYSVPPEAALPLVTTVYDMMHEQFFHLCHPAVYPMIEAKRQAIRAARVCICISHATAADLIRFYPEVQGRVRVTHLGYDHLVGDGDEPTESIDTPKFVLFVGERGQYKNFAIVLEAMSCGSWPDEVSLHIVGPALSRAESALISSLRLSDRVQSLGKVDDSTLRAEYRKATAFVFPSRIEGFGIPILEAQANGCVVICSDIPVFREIAGPAGIFFAPGSAEQLAVAITACREPDVRGRLIEAGYQNIRRFSWERCVRETIDIYHETFPGRWR